MSRTTESVITPEQTRMRNIDKAGGEQYDAIDEPRDEPRADPGRLIRHLDVFRRFECDFGTHGTLSMSSFITRNKPEWDELEALVG